MGVWRAISGRRARAYRQNGDVELHRRTMCEGGRQDGECGRCRDEVSRRRWGESYLRLAGLAIRPEVRLLDAEGQEGFTLRGGSKEVSYFTLRGIGKKC